MGLFDTLRRALGMKPARRDNYAATYGNGSGGGFAGSSVNRLTASLATWSGSVNADLDGSLVILRARGRQLAASNEYGRRFLSMVATNVVGRKGPALQVRAKRDQRDPNKPTTLDKSANDAVEIHWQLWGKRADITGRADFAHQCRVIAKAVARDGEALIRIVTQRDLPYGIAIQLLEVDRLDESINQVIGSTTIRQGVEIDSTGRPVAYWIKADHPGERYGGKGTVERVPADQIIHAFLPERAEQVRGYTWFHAILLRAHQLHGYNDSAVIAARIGASKIATLEADPDSAPAGNAGDMLADSKVGGIPQINAEGGEILDLTGLPGVKLNSWNPDYPHANFESFVKACMRGISAGLDVATHNLSGDMTDVNYSSARIAELSEREVWMILQDWFIFQVVEPIYQRWLAIALLRGDITFEVSGKSLPADKFSKFANASRFQGRRWRWVDPAKEMAAFKEAVDLKVTSRTRIAAEQGEDFEDVLDELAQEDALIDAAGLKPAPPPAAPAADPNLQKNPPNAAAEDDATKAMARMHADVLATLRELMARPPAAGESSTTRIKVENGITEADVRTTVREEMEAMPIIINVPQQAAPVVNVAGAVVNVEPTPVTMEATFNPEISLRATLDQAPRKTTSEIVRDAGGNIISTTQIERNF